jgi:hypothetical protein
MVQDVGYENFKSELLCLAKYVSNESEFSLKVKSKTSAVEAGSAETDDK